MAAGTARGRTRRLALIALAGAAFASPASADEPPVGATWTEASLTASDGTRLHADVFRPDGRPVGERLPVVLIVSPYLGSAPDDPGPTVLRWYRTLYERALARGHAVVQVSMRGTGASEGCFDFGGPGVLADVRAAVEWAAEQPWSSGRVGVAGHSFDGYAAAAALAQRLPAVRAAVLMAPAIDLYRGAYMNGVGYLQRSAVGPYYQGLSLVPQLDPGTVAPSLSTDPACSAAVVEGAADADRGTPFWRGRDLADRAAGTTVPVLWAHGFLDGRDDFSAVRPDNFPDLWSRLAGPRRGWFGQFPHVVPGEHNTWNEPEPVGRDGFVDEALDWMDAHVRGEPDAVARVSAAPPVLVQDGARGRWRAEPQWPPATLGEASLALAPGAYADEAGNKAEQGDDPGGGCADGARARCNPAAQTGRGAWTFSRPLPRAVRVAGAPRIEATLRTGAAGARVIVLVYDVDGANRATLLTRGASLVGGDGRVAFGLYPQDWRLEAGHRLAVLLSGSDEFYFESGTTGARVEVVDGRVTLPLAPVSESADVGGPSRAVLERTSFPVEPAAAERELILPRELERPRPQGLRLTRVCTRPGRLRMEVRGDVDGVRRVVFKLGRRTVARDARAPFRRVVPRRVLARTRARRLRAVVGPAEPVLVRPLPRCGLRRAR